MMYRQPEPAPPLVSFVGNHLVAFDAERGTVLWSQSTGDKRPGRVLCAGSLLFVATNGPEMREPSQILIHELATGVLRGTIDTAFEISAALVRDDRLYFAGNKGVIVLAATGAIMWRALVTVAKSGGPFVSDDLELVTSDASGRVIDRRPVDEPGTNGLLVLGHLASQRDFDT